MSKDKTTMLRTSNRADELSELIAIARESNFNASNIIDFLSKEGYTKKDIAITISELIELGLVNY